MQPRRFLSRNLLSGGIIAREVRASLPAVVAVAALQSVYPLLKGIGATLRGHSFALDGGDVAYPWAVSSIVMALLLGVLCGGEEEENGTADFPRRLPIPSLRILAEKITGSLVAFVLWAILAFLFDMLVVAFSGRFGAGAFFSYAARERLFLLPASWGVLLYGFGLAAGAWTRRVLLAAVVGGLGAWIYGTVAVILTVHGELRTILIQRVWPYQAFWLGCLLALAAAAVRYRTREGT